MSELSADDWVSDDDDDAVAEGGFVTPPSGASPVKKTADAVLMQKAREEESPASAALRRSKDLDARQRKRSADAAEGRADVGDDAAAGGGCMTPSSRPSPVKKADAKRKKKARQGETPKKAAARRLKDIQARQSKRSADAAAGWTDAEDVVVAGSGCVTPPSGASPVKKAADAKRKQKARHGESPAKAALRSSNNCAAMRRKRLLDAADGRADVGDHAAAGGGCLTPPSRPSPVKSTGVAAGRQQAPQLHSTAKTAQKKRAQKALQLSAIGATDLLVAKVFNAQEQEYLEANFDHDPAAAIAWMAASSQASFGYQNCPLDEQLEAVLGTDCSKVLPQGIRERIVNEMKEAMDCRHIQSCAACGFRGYQIGSPMNVDTDLQWLEMSAEALSRFEAKSPLYQQVSSSVLREGKRYHLHQELVAEDGSTWICDACNQGAHGAKFNPMSLKAGVDQSDNYRYRSRKQPYQTPL